MRLFTLVSGTRLVRVSTDEVGTTEPSASSSARWFSPVRAGRTPVPVLYAGEDLSCALDDDAAAPQEILRADLLTLLAGTIEVDRALSLADLRDPALEAYGVAREQVVGTGPQDYAITARWGQAVWDGTTADGLVWHSRRSPGRLSVMLFVDAPHPVGRGVRRRDDLRPVAPPLPLHDCPGLGEVMTAASARNVTVVIP